MIKYFKDENRQYYRPELFSEDAQEQARKLRQGSINSSQFRNYFQELRSLEQQYRNNRLTNPDRAWQLLEPQLHLLKAKVAYGARNNGPLNRAPEFRAFMDDVLASVTNASEFEAMMLYVEAVLAYFYSLESNRSGYGGKR